MRLPEFDYVEPESIAEVCALLEQDAGNSKLFAGGTDILVYLKEGAPPHRRLIALRRIERLHRLDFSEKSGLVIGAMATINQIARHEAARVRYPGLVEAALSLADDQVRNLATVGGNLCNAVPSADMAPILLAHGATLRVANHAGERTISIGEFFLGPRKTALQPTDVLLAIELPAPGPGKGDASFRQGGRASLSLPVSVVAAVVSMEGPVCREARLALGAVAPTPRIAESVTRLLDGKRLTGELLEEAGELAGAETQPITDVRSSKEYRVESVKVLTRRVLALAAERAGER